MLVTGGGGGGKEGNTWEDPAANSKGVGVDTGNGLASPSSNGGAASPSGSGNGRSMAGAVGVATTCFACNVPRVSRRVTCQGCGETFHWSCIGFYEHKYQRPGDNWRCKGCKGVEPPPAAAAAGAAGTLGLPMTRAPQSGEAIDVGIDPPPSTTPLATLPLAALVRAETSDASVVVTTAAMAVPAAAVAAAAAAAASSTAAAAETEAAAAAVPAVAAAPVAAAAVTVPVVPAVPAVAAAPAAAVPAVPAVTVTAPVAAVAAPASVEAARKVLEVNLPLPVATLPAGEPVCPVCRKFIGRKRTMDCSVCRVPSHAGCVNVRGAETPIHWVCRDCRSGVDRNAEAGVSREVAGASSSAGAGAGMDTARDEFPKPPPQPVQHDFLGELIHHRRPRPAQVQSTAPAVSVSAAAAAAASAALLAGGKTQHGGNGGSVGVLGEDLSEYDGSADDTESEQERTSPRAAAARLAKAKTKSLETTTRLQSLVAARDGVVGGAAAATVSGEGAGEAQREVEGGAREDAGRDWDSDMDVATEDLQESIPPSRSSRREGAARRKPPPPPPPVKPPSATTGVREQAPVVQQTTRSEANPLADPIASPVAAVSNAAALPPPPLPSTRSGPSLPEVVEGPVSAAPPPLPPFDPLAFSAPMPSHAPMRSATTTVLGAEPFSPLAEGWSLTSTGVQPPLPTGPPPPPPPPPPPAPVASKSTTVPVQRSSALLADVELIPLGRPSSMGRTKVASEPGRLKGVGSKAAGTGSKAAGTGKRSYLFSEEEQRAMGSGGKAKAKSGSIPSVRAKIKGKKLGAAAKPTVATLFTAEGQVVMQKRTPGSGKKRVPSPAVPRSGSVFNLEEVIASIERRDEQRQQSDSLGSSSRRGPLPASESIPKKDRYRISGAASPLLSPASQSVASCNHLPARTPATLAEVAPRAKRQSTRWAPPPASGADMLSNDKSSPVAGATSSKTRSASKAGTAEHSVRGASDGTRGARGGKCDEAGARGSSPGGASLRTPKRSSRAGHKSKRSRGRLSSSSSSGSASSSSSSGGSSYRNSSRRSGSGGSSSSRSGSSSRGRSHSRSGSRSASTHKRGERRFSKGGSGGGSGIGAGERGSSRDRHGARSFGRHDSRSSYSGSRGRIETNRGVDRIRSSSRGDRSDKGGLSRSSSDSRGRQGERDNSREREIDRAGRGASRPHGEGKGSQTAGKWGEQAKSRTSGSSSGQIPKKGPGPRGAAYENDHYRGRDTSRDRSGRGGSKDHDQPDPYARNRHGSRERNRSRSSERRGGGRHTDKHVMRARPKSYGGGGRHQDTPSRRPDDGRQEESPIPGSSRSKPSPAGRARHTPSNGPGFTEGSPGGGRDRSATRCRRAQGDPSPLTGNTLSSAYDHLPMPTSSIEFHSSMGGDDLFSSLEDQLYDHDMRGGDAAVGPKARRPSISSSTTSPHPAPVVKTPAAVAANPASASSSASTASGATSAARPEGANVAGVPGMSRDDGGDADAGGDKPPSKMSIASPETTEGESQSLPTVASAPPPPSSPPSPPPPPPPSTPSVPHEVAASLTEAAATVATEGVAPPISTSVTTTSRGQPIAQPPSSPPLASGGDPPLASGGDVATDAAADESISAEAATAAAAAANAVAGPAAATAVPEAGEASSKVHAASTSLDGKGGAIADDSSSLGASGIVGEPAGDVDVGLEKGCDAADRDEVAVAVAGWETGRRINGAEDEGTSEVGRGVGGMGSPQVARGQVEGDDKGEGSAGEDEMLDSIKSPTQSKSPANRKRIGGSPWYKKGTSVVLNCGPGVKPGNPNPMVALADLVDRPATVIKQPAHLKGPRYHMVEFQPWEGGPSTSVTMNVRANLLKPEPSGAGSPLPGGGDSAESSSAGPAAGTAAGTAAGAALDGREEAAVGEAAISEAVAGATRGVLTRKAVREVEQRSSMDANDAGVGDGAGSDGDVDVGDDMKTTEEEEAGAMDERGVDGSAKGGGVEEDQEQEVVEEEQKETVEVQEEEDQEQEVAEKEQEETVEVQEEAAEEEQAAVEKKQGEGRGKVAGKGSVDVAAGTALDVTAMVAAGQSLDDPLKPAFVPVGTRVILTEPTSSKPRGGSVSGADMVGKTAVVTKMATHLMGPRYHDVLFEPWPGGPSATITWKLPRKCFSLCPPDHGTGTAPASAVAVAAPALELLAASTGGLAAHNTPAATAEAEEGSQEDDLEDSQEEDEQGEENEEEDGEDEAEEDEEDEDEDEEMEEATEEEDREPDDKEDGEKGQNQDQGREEAGGGKAAQTKGQSAEKEQAAESGRVVLSPPPESVLVYPTGTAVVVRSVQRKPGRTLKFARGESYEASFEELLGREGVVIRTPSLPAKGFRHHLVEYQPWEDGPTKPFTWNVKMAALEVLRWPQPSDPNSSGEEKEEEQEDGEEEEEEGEKEDKEEKEKEEKEEEKEKEKDAATGSPSAEVPQIAKGINTTEPVLPEVVEPAPSSATGAASAGSTASEVDATAPAVTPASVAATPEVTEMPRAGARTRQRSRSFSGKVVNGGETGDTGGVEDWKSSQSEARMLGLEAAVAEVEAGLGKEAEAVAVGMGGGEALSSGAPVEEQGAENQREEGVGARNATVREVGDAADPSEDGVGTDGRDTGLEEKEEEGEAEWRDESASRSTRRSSGKARETPSARKRGGGRPTRQSSRRVARPGHESVSSSPARATKPSVVVNESVAGLEVEGASFAPDEGVGGRKEDHQEASETVEAAPQVPAELHADEEHQTLAEAATESPASAVKRRRLHASPQTSGGVQAKEAVAPEQEDANPDPSAEVPGTSESETAAASAAAAAAASLSSSSAAAAAAAGAPDLSRKVSARVSADAEAAKAELAKRMREEAEEAAKVAQEKEEAEEAERVAEEKEAEEAERVAEEKARAKAAKVEKLKANKRRADMLKAEKAEKAKAAKEARVAKARESKAAQAKAAREAKASRDSQAALDLDAEAAENACADEITAVAAASELPVAAREGPLSGEQEALEEEQAGGGPLRVGEQGLTRTKKTITQQQQQQQQQPPQVEMEKNDEEGKEEENDDGEEEEEKKKEEKEKKLEEGGEKEKTPAAAETAGEQDMGDVSATEENATGRRTRKAAAIANHKLRKRKADGSSTDRVANAGNDRRQKRAASSRNNGERAPNHDDQQTEHRGAGHTETDVVGEEGDRVEAMAAGGAATPLGNAKDSDDTVSANPASTKAAAASSPGNEVASVLPNASAAPRGTESALGGSAPTAKQAAATAVTATTTAAAAAAAIAGAGAGAGAVPVVESQVGDSTAAAAGTGPAAEESGAAVASNERSTATESMDVHQLQKMVQVLQEEVRGFKSQLKRKRGSTEGGGGGGGSRRHPRGRRGSKGSPSRLRDDKRGSSSSSPALGSDHDSRSGEWSSSGDEAGVREGKGGVSGYRGSHRRPPASARGDAVEHGFYPYLGPPGAYPYPPPPPGYYAYGGTPSQAAAAGYGSVYPGLVYGRHGHGGAGGGGEWEGYHRFERRRRRSGSEQSHSHREHHREHRLSDEEDRPGSSPRGSYRRGADGGGSGGGGGDSQLPGGGCDNEGNANIATSSARVDAAEATAEGKGGGDGGGAERGAGERSGIQQERGVVSSTPGGRGSEKRSWRREEAGEDRGRGGAESVGGWGGSSRGTGPRDGKLRRRGDDGRHVRDKGYYSGGGGGFVAHRGFMFPMGAAGGVMDPRFAPPPATAPADPGGYASPSPYMVPHHPVGGVFHEHHAPPVHYLEAPGWAAGGHPHHAHPPYPTPAHPHHRLPTDRERHGSRRRKGRSHAPENSAGDRVTAFGGGGDSGGVGGGGGGSGGSAERGASFSRRGRESRRRSPARGRSRSGSGSRSRSESGSWCSEKAAA